MKTFVVGQKGLYHSIKSAERFVGIIVYVFRKNQWPKSELIFKYYGAKPPSFSVFKPCRVDRVVIMKPNDSFIICPAGRGYFK